MKVQESKKQLAGVLLSGHDGGQADSSLGALEVSIHHWKSGQSLTFATAVTFAALIVMLREEEVVGLSSLSVDQGYVRFTRNERLN